MKEVRLRWYGYVVKAFVESVARLALAVSLDGQWLKRWSKKQWIDYLQEGRRALGVCPTNAANWKKWWAKCKTAETHHMMGITQKNKKVLFLSTNSVLHIFPNKSIFKDPRSEGYFYQVGLLATINHLSFTNYFRLDS